MNRSYGVVLFSISCLLATPLLAQTQIGGGACNSASLNGSYQLLLAGRQVTTTGTVSKIFSAVGVAMFDGQSKVTFTMTANIVSTSQNFGAPLVYSGTYSLQADCLGTIGITGGDTATFTLEAHAQGKAFALAGTDATYAYNGTGNLQPSSCQTSTLSGVHEFNATGNTLAGTTVSGIADVAGVLQFDGQGNVTASWTVITNAGTSPVTSSGTYSVTTACLGSAMLTDTTGKQYTVSLSLYSTAADFALSVASQPAVFQGYGSAAYPGSSGTCSASVLNGTYEFGLGGRQLTSAGSIARLVQASGAAAFDGQGKVTLTMTANSVNGSQAFGTPLVYSGTYTLQSNCMGSISITSGDNATFTLVAFSINANTQQAAVFTMVGSDPTYIYSAGGNVQPGACNVSTLSGTWPFSATGNTLSGTSVSGVLDVAGELQFDGQGNVTASWASLSNTASSTITAAGTYSVTAACLGSATLTDSASNRYTWTVGVFGAAAANFGLVVSNSGEVFQGTGRASFTNPGQAVVNGASDAPGFTPPGSVFTIFGFNLATGQAQPSSLPLPTTVLTTTVTVNGEPAPIFYLNPGQINAQMPQDVQPGLATVIVKNGTSVSNAAAVVVPATATPGISVYGQNRAVVVDASQNNVVNSPTSPAKVGDVMVAYFTGGGPVKAAGPLATGTPAPNGLSPVTGVNTVTVNGKDANVTYIGLTPGGIGLYQANFQVPQVVAGDHPLVITISGQASNRPLIAIGN